MDTTEQAELRRITMLIQSIGTRVTIAYSEPARDWYANADGIEVVEKGGTRCGAIGRADTPHEALRAGFAYLTGVQSPAFIQRRQSGIYARAGFRWNGYAFAELSAPELSMSGGNA